MDKLTNTSSTPLNASKEVSSFIADTIELALLNEHSVSPDDDRVVELISVTPSSVVLNFDGQVYEIHLKAELIPIILVNEPSNDIER